MTTTIYIDNSGDIIGLADDVIDKLKSLGKKQVKRVSEVEFNHLTQQWEAVDVSGTVIATHPIRSEVIAMERAYFNQSIENSFASGV
jgi:hypothetical protein